MSRFYIFTLLINIYEEDIMWNAQLDEAEAGIKITGRSINNFRYADDTTLKIEMKKNLRPSWWSWKKRAKSLD